MDDSENWRVWASDPDLWEKLKPAARRMRRTPTPSEERLWQSLRERRLLGFKFRRQHAIGQFIVDFYCAKARLVIEVDGPVHKRSAEEDAARQIFLESRGLRVLRFTNAEVDLALEGVLKRITGVLARDDLK